MKNRISKTTASLFFFAAAAFGETAASIDVAKFQYDGQTSDAPWRRSAAERIEKYRKGNLSVTVVDEAGRPIADADVQVRMTRHAFRFGSNLRLGLLLDDPKYDPEDTKRYRQEFLRLFNYATVNWFYYNLWKTPEKADDTREQVYAATKWLAGHNIPMRGHTLVWNFNDENIKKGKQHAHDCVVQHLQQTVGDPKIAAMISEWDVQNEPSRHSDIFDLLGRESVAEWFRRTHEFDPGAKLFLNDAGMVSRMGAPDWAERINFTCELVKYLQEQGSPIHGLGLQSHHLGSLASIPKALEVMDRLAELGLPLQVTEYDIKLTRGEETKNNFGGLMAPAPTSPELERHEGQYMRDFLTACFSHPSMDAFIMWGFWDGFHWLHNAPIFRKDWTLKPQGRAYIDLVFGEWWTHANGQTQADGTFKVRGFLGSYEITANKGGRMATIEATLGRAGSEVNIVLR